MRRPTRIGPIARGVFGRTLRAILAVGVALVAADATRAEEPRNPEVHLRVRDVPRVRATFGSSTARGRFLIEVRVEGLAATPGSFAMTVGDTTLDVALDRGRFTGRVVTDHATLQVRVGTRRRMLRAFVRGTSADGGGAPLAGWLNLGDAAEGATTHVTWVGAAQVAVDGTPIPVAYGVAGRIDSRGAPDDCDPRTPGSTRIRATLLGAGSGPLGAEMSPVVQITPQRPGRPWRGRLRGHAFAVGSPPSLALSTASGRARGASPRGVSVFDPAIGDYLEDGAEPADPARALYEADFDLVVQAPPGRDAATVTARNSDGRTGRDTRTFVAPDPDPPLLMDAQWQVLEVRSGGDLWAWGSNLFGEVGDGTHRDPYTPVPLPRPARVVSVAAGEWFSLAADDAGSVWIWGELWNTRLNESGGVSVDATPNRPMRMPRLSGIVSVGAGEDTALAVDADGVVWGWGDAFDGFAGTSLRPRRVRGLPPARSAVASDEWIFVVDREGGVWAVTPGAETHWRIEGLPEVREVAAGWNGAVALDETGAVWTWSLAADGSAPSRLSLDGTATQVASADDYALALGSDGGVRTWNGFGAEATAPVLLEAPGDVVRIAAGVSYALAVDGDGALWSWDAYDAQAGSERPSLVERQFREGHAPREYFCLAKRPEPTRRGHRVPHTRPARRRAR